MRSCPNSARLDAALDSLEFMVSIDIYLNETTRHADVVLPSPSALAKPHLDLAFYGLSVRNVVNYSATRCTRPTTRASPGLDEHDIFAKVALIAGGMGADADPSILTTMMLSTLADRAGLDVEAELCRGRRHHHRSRRCST